MLAWNDSLAPGHSRDSEGRLRLGAHRADFLASVYGTPLVVMDTDIVRRVIDSLCATCEPLGMRISYAAKAFLCTEFARLLTESSLGMDVCSLGELEVAERSGFDAARLTMHGAGKTDGELCAALEGRVGRIVMDGLSDLERLSQLARGSDPIQVLLRLNTGVDVDTHAHVRTVGADSKFGLTPEEEAAAANLIKAGPALKFIGLHAHPGSQITDVASLVANLSQLIRAAERFADYGLTCSTLIAGGGFGVQSHPGRSQDGLDIGAAIAACKDRVDAANALQSRPTIEFEPGRSIVAHAGTSIYQILSVKRRADGNLLVVDGGMADNPRPALYGAYHHVVPILEETGVKRLTSVFGRACESDFIANAMLPDNLDRGDLLAVCTTGAYTHSMSSNYNGFRKPAVVGVSERGHDLWVAAG
jgi:diaminopimelate decarboxylase